jgi:hypothetical protein
VGAVASAVGAAVAVAVAVGAAAVTATVAVGAMSAPPVVDPPLLPQAARAVAPNSINPTAISRFQFMWLFPLARRGFAARGMVADVFPPCLREP